MEKRGALISQQAYGGIIPIVFNCTCSNGNLRSKSFLAVAYAPGSVGSMRKN